MPPRSLSLAATHAAARRLRVTRLPLLHRSAICRLIELRATKGHTLTTKRGLDVGIGQPRREPRSL
jgi:hypothetical protein